MNPDVKRATKEDVQPLAELSDKVFRPSLPAGTAMGVEFAPMFSSENAQNLYFVERDGLPVSLVGMVKSRVCIHGASVSAASMGSVCTLAEYRKHHFASAMVEQVIEDFSPSTSVLLVSGELSIYRRVGCVNFGNWVEASIDSKGASRPNGVQNRDVQIIRGVPDSSAMLKLYRNEPLRYSRSQASMEQLLATMTAPRFRNQTRAPETFAGYRHGELVAYAIASQSDHRPEFIRIFEWAGDRSVLLDLVAAAQGHFGSTTARLMSSPSDVVLRSELLSAGASLVNTRNQGTLRVLNPTLLLQEMGDLIEELHGARLELAANETNCWNVRWIGPNADHLPGHGICLRGFDVLSSWLFDSSGLGLPFPRTDDLNFA